jgi:hypothetical protein
VTAAAPDTFGQAQTELLPTEQSIGSPRWRERRLPDPLFISVFVLLPKDPSIKFHASISTGLPHKAVPVSKLEPVAISHLALDVRFGSKADI